MYGENYAKTTEISGAFAQAILQRAGYTEGKVEIADWTESSGGCETCWFDWEMFAIYVDGKQVYSGEGTGSIADLNYWMNDV